MSSGVRRSKVDVMHVARMDDVVVLFLILRLILGVDLDGVVVVVAVAGVIAVVFFIVDWGSSNGLLFLFLLMMIMSLVLVVLGVSFIFRSDDGGHFVASGFCCS